MKIIYFLILSACIVSGCNGNKKLPKRPEIVKIEETKEYSLNIAKDTIDLGNLKEGVNTEFIIHLYNRDSIPVIIIDIIPDCGCTAIEYDKKPLMPGAYSKVSFSYDSRNQRGIQVKNINIVASSASEERTKRLTIKSIVELHR